MEADREVGSDSSSDAPSVEVYPVPGLEAAPGPLPPSVGTSSPSQRSASSLTSAQFRGAAEVGALLALADEVCDRDVRPARKRDTLEALCMALRPEELGDRGRMVFVQLAMARGVVQATVELIEQGCTDLACAASNFLGDFAFNSDVGACAVLAVFDRIARCFRRVFNDPGMDRLPLLDAAILLCANIAATCPSGHGRLVPLVRDVCMKIIENRAASDKLRGNTILLLANLSMTVGAELRELRVADVLLDLITEQSSPGLGQSVAESVVIFLHGDRRCTEIDRLMDLGVVSQYCVPIMEKTLRGAEFRGMYPHLLYSARLFEVLARSRDYAEALAANPDVVPLLLRVCHCQERPLRVASDRDGRRLSLEALASLAEFGLWPQVGTRGGGPHGGQTAVDCASFMAIDAPQLLADEDPGIRSSASRLWANVNRDEVVQVLLVGSRFEAAEGLPAGCWRWRIMPFIFPFLGGPLLK